MWPLVLMKVMTPWYSWRGRLETIGYYIHFIINHLSMLFHLIVICDYCVSIIISNTIFLNLILMSDLRVWDAYKYLDKPQVSLRSFKTSEYLTYIARCEVDSSWLRPTKVNLGQPGTLNRQDTLAYDDLSDLSDLGGLGRPGEAWGWPQVVLTP